MEFESPVVCVAAGLSTMHGTHVPEAAVDEYGDMQTDKHDVGADDQTRNDDLVVLAEPEASTMEDRPQERFGLAIHFAVGPRPAKLRTWIGRHYLVLIVYWQYGTISQPAARSSGSMRFVRVAHSEAAVAP